MHKILFISFEFHPVQTTGNFRAANFVKYFSEFGIEPVVLCGAEESILQYYKSGRINNALLADIPTGCEVHRVPFDKPYIPASKYAQLKYYADPICSFWKKAAFKKALEIIGQTPSIKAILVSLPPFSVGDLAMKVSKKTGLPLFVDLRDAWSYQGQFPFFSRAHYFANFLKEKRLLKHATAIITVTNQLAEIYVRTNTGLDESNVKIVYNSYTNFDIEKQETIPAKSAIDTDQYIIGYIGAFYFNPESEKIRITPWWKRSGVRKFFYYSAKEEWIYRTPYFFFKSLARLFNKHPLLRKKVFFGHIGDTPQWLYRMAKEFGVQDNIMSYGFVKKDELASVVQNFSAFLATTEKIPVNKSFCLPSKTFDYIKYGKPIIGFVKQGDYSEFLEKANMGVIIDPDNISEATEKLESFLLTGKELAPKKSYILNFHAREQTRLLSNILKEKLT